MAGAFDAVRCGSTGPDGWHLKYAELHRRILSGRAPQRYMVAQVGRFPRRFRAGNAFSISSTRSCTGASSRAAALHGGAGEGSSGLSQGKRNG